MSTVLRLARSTQVRRPAVVHVTQCQGVAIGKTECRWWVLRCECAWKSGAGIFLSPTGSPAVRSKGEDRDERDSRSRTSGARRRVAEGKRPSYGYYPRCAAARKAAEA